MRTDNEKRSQWIWDHSERGKRAIRNSRLKCKYGITLVDAERMLKEQGGLCANIGCGQTITLLQQKSNDPHSAHVDHDHATGVVRGLLCYACNVSLGYLKEDRHRIFGLAEYILKHQSS